MQGPTGQRRAAFKESLEFGQGRILEQIPKVNWKEKIKGSGKERRRRLQEMILNAEKKQI